MASYLITLGDSVHWGQGLRPEHKLHSHSASHGCWPAKG